MGKLEIWNFVERIQQGGLWNDRPLLQRSNSTEKQRINIPPTFPDTEAKKSPNQVENCRPLRNPFSLYRSAQDSVRLRVSNDLRRS